MYYIILYLYCTYCMYLNPTHRVANKLVSMSLSHFRRFLLRMCYCYFSSFISQWPDYCRPRYIREKPLVRDNNLLCYIAIYMLTFIRKYRYVHKHAERLERSIFGQTSSPAFCRSMPDNSN